VDARLPAVLVLTDRHMAAAAGHTLPRLVLALAGLDVAVLLREKDLPSEPRAALAREVADAASRAGIVLLVASSVELAQRIGASGVHLAAADPPGPRGLVGRSCHDARELAAAGTERVDYVTLSPVFPTASKPGHGPPLGLAGLGHLAREATVPVYALGGVVPGRAAECVAAGAYGVAALGSVMRAPAPATVAAALADEVRAGRTRSRESAFRLRD